MDTGDALITNTSSWKFNKSRSPFEDALNHIALVLKCLFKTNWVEQRTDLECFFLDMLVLSVEYFGVETNLAPI